MFFYLASKKIIEKINMDDSTLNKKQKTARTWSKVWDHFIRIRDPRDVNLPLEQQRTTHVKCTLCTPPLETIFKWHGTTSHMNDHLYSPTGRTILRNLP